MLELELDKAEGMLEAYKPDSDKEGKFAYLQLSFGKLTADKLTHFGEGDLKDRMFRVEQDLGGDVLRVRDTGEVYPQERSESMSGAVLTIGYGVSGPMVFTGTALDNFKVTPQDGGFVVISMRAKVRPDEVQAGKLYMLNEGPVQVSLEPMEPPAMKEAA